MTESDIPAHFQLDSFSGATFKNALTLVKQLPNGHLDQLIISIGINHKDDDFGSYTAAALGSFLKSCGEKAKEVITVGVSINSKLSDLRKDNLAEINNRLQQITHNKYVKPLSSHQIHTQPDTIHYTRETQLEILNRIVQYANTSSKN